MQSTLINLFEPQRSCPSAYLWRKERRKIPERLANETVRSRVRVAVFKLVIIHHLLERIAPRKIESRRTPLKTRRACMRQTRPSTQVLNFPLSILNSPLFPEKASPSIAPAIPDRVSGRGDLQIACASLRDDAGSRRCSRLLVTQRSDQRPGGAAAAGQRNHQGSPARRRDRRLARGQFPIRYRKPRQEARCPSERRYFFAAADAAKNPQCQNTRPEADPVDLRALARRSAMPFTPTASIHRSARRWRGAQRACPHP